MDPTGRAISITATGVLDPRAGVLMSFSVTAAAATALLILTDGQGGAELGRQSAAANTSAERQYTLGVRYTTGLYATLTGASALGDAEVA